MRPRVFALSALSLAVLVLACLLGGCQVSIHKPGQPTVLFTARQTALRAAPDYGATVLASLGPNAEVVATDQRNGFTRVDFDGGRISGWVENDALSPAPVRERAPKRTSAKSRPGHAADTPATSAGAEKPSAEPAQAAPTPAAQTPAAPESARKAAPAPQSPPPAAEPAPSAPSSGLLSPAEAQAATAPPADAQKAKAKPAPVKGKQAQPEAFDPF